KVETEVEAKVEEGVAESVSEAEAEEVESKAVFEAAALDEFVESLPTEALSSQDYSLVCSDAKFAGGTGFSEITSLGSFSLSAINPSCVPEDVSSLECSDHASICPESVQFSPLNAMDSERRDACPLLHVDEGVLRASSQDLPFPPSVEYAHPFQVECVDERQVVGSAFSEASIANRVHDMCDTRPVESALLVSEEMPSEICIPVSDLEHFKTTATPPLLPVSDLLVPVSHPIEMEIAETVEAKSSVPLYLGLTHNDRLYPEQTKPLEYAPVKATYSHPEKLDQDVHIGLTESTKEQISNVKSLPPVPSPKQAISVEAEDHLSALPGVSKESLSEAAIYIDESGKELPIVFSRASTSEIAKPIVSDENLTSATHLAVTDSEHVESYSATQKSVDLPEIVIAEKCLIEHSSHPSLPSMIGSVETPPQTSILVGSSLEIRPKVPPRLFYAANTQEVVWEEVVLMDHGVETPLPFPNVSLIVPLPEPTLSASPQRSFVHTCESDRPILSETDLIPSYASLPRPKAKELEGGSCGEDGSATHDHVCFGASAPEIRPSKSVIEPSAEVMNLLSLAPISSAPVSSEAMVSDVSSPIESLSSPAIVPTSEGPPTSSGELDVYIISPSSSEEGAKQVQEKMEVAIVNEPTEGKVAVVKEEPESGWDYLSQLAAAAGATLAAEYASDNEDSDDSEDNEEDYGYKSMSMKQSRHRPAPEATLDRSSQLLSRLKFYGLGTQQVSQPSPRLCDVERGMSRDIEEESEEVEEQIAEEVILEDEEEEDEDERPKLLIEGLESGLPTIPEVAGPLSPDDDDSLNEEELPADLKLVPAHEDEEEEEEEVSQSHSRPVSEYHKQLQSLSWLSASSQRSSFTTTATDTTEESSQATVILVGSATEGVHGATKTTPESLESDLNLMDESRISTAGSLPHISKETADVSTHGQSGLASAVSTDQVIDEKPSGSRHLADTASTPSMLERSTSSGIYFPQKGRLRGFPRKCDPGTSEPVLSKTEAISSQSSSLAAFELLEQQITANSSPDSLQKSSGEVKKSSSSKTSSSLSEFERIEAEMAKSSSGSSAELPSGVAKAVGDSSQSSLSEFLRVEQECASSQESVHQQPIDTQLVALAHKTIDTIYEDVLAEQMCQSIETSRITDSSEIAGDVDSLVQSSLHDSLAGSLSHHEVLPTDLIRSVIRGARDAIERGHPRDRDSLGEADSSEEDFPQIMETSIDSLDGVQQHSQQGPWGDSSLSDEPNYNRQMTDSLEDSGAAMASGSRASTQPPSQSEVLFMLIPGPPPVPIQSSELPQVSLPRSTSEDEALLKKADTDEDVQYRLLPASMSITSLNLAQEQPLTSQTDSNLGSTVFDISEDEFKGPVCLEYSMVESPLKSLSASPILIRDKFVEGIPEISSPITPMAEPFSPKDISTPTMTEGHPCLIQEQEAGDDFEIVQFSDFDYPPEQK
ncbi:unnamed protein product, partial [Rodentolepis nana]|uniref:Reticulon n=1 Tax=Rodentolepis nana TaxID=102285 RepID=A0A0R3TZE9_RODNA